MANKTLVGAVVVVAVILAWYARPQTTIAPSINPQTAAPHQPPTTVLFFAGDIMLSRHVGTKITETKNPALPFLSVAERIQAADISFANLESPFLDSKPRVTEGLVFKAEPEYVAGLKLAGFDILSTANNHSFDQGRDGIDYTLSWLAENGIMPIGTGSDCHDGKIITANGVDFGYLAYSYTAYNSGGSIPDPLVCSWFDSEKVRADVAKMRMQADVVIVSAHTGIEYQRQPTPADVERAHLAIDAGVDLVIGHHPHWVQTTEQYRGKWILHSLGNFVFDQMWSQDTRQGLAAEIHYDKTRLQKIILHPVIIDDYCCARWASAEESLTILRQINLTDPILFSKD